MKNYEAILNDYFEDYMKSDRVSQKDKDVIADNIGILTAVHEYKKVIGDEAKQKPEEYIELGKQKRFEELDIQGELAKLELRKIAYKNTDKIK